MAHESSDIRNVCLVGPGDSGKTQLTEALLHAGGAIPECGSVDQGNTVSDFTPREKQLGHSGILSADLSPYSLRWKPRLS
jgi:translation elongation factor EF-G